MNRQFLFIKSATESIALPVDSFSHAEYTSDTTVSVYFNATRSGKDASVKVVLTVSSGKANDVVTSITNQVASGNSPVMKYDDVKDSFYTKNVTAITSITTTESPCITTGPTGPAGATGATGPAGSDATGLGGTNQTLSGNRVVEMGSNTLDFQSSSASKFKIFNTGTVTSTGRLTVGGNGATGGTLRVGDSSGQSNIIGLQHPDSGSGYTLKLPIADGSANQVLKTDGSGNLGFSDHAAKTYGSITCGFFDDIGTSAHYFPLNGPPTEVTSDNNSFTDWLCPCDIVVKSVQLRISGLNSSGNLTLTVEKDAIGSGTDTDVESETLAISGSGDFQDVLHFLFDSASLSAGEKLKIKMQADSDIMVNSNIFAVVVYEADWSTRYTQASAVISS